MRTAAQSKTAVVSLLLALLAVAGCASEKKARDQERQAYLAGQQQAMMQLSAQRPPPQEGQVVFVQGSVRNPVVPWEEGLTLSQAIVKADYTAFMNPEHIQVIRNGQIIAECKGIDLLHHQDMPLENGDTVRMF